MDAGVDRTPEPTELRSLGADPTLTPFPRHHLGPHATDAPEGIGRNAPTHQLSAGDNSAASEYGGSHTAGVHQVEDLDDGRRGVGPQIASGEVTRSSIETNREAG